MRPWGMGLGPVMCVIVTSDNKQQSKHSRRRGLRWVEIDFMLFLCFSGGCSVHQLSWVDEIIFAVCLYLTWHKPDIDTDIRIMAPGIIGAICFNAGPWLQITNTEIISGPASGQCPDTPDDVRPPMSLVSTHRVWVWCQWEPGELLPEREPAHYALRRARPGLRNAGLQVVTRPVHWRLETSHNQWVISQEGTRRAVRVCRVRTQCYKGDKRHVSPACSDLEWPAEAAAWCGTPGWGWDRESRHLTWAGLRARARDGWKCFVFSWQQRGAEGRGQRRQPGTQAQVGGEIGQRHGNIYESNYFGTELGETQGFSYSLGKCGCWPPLAKQFRIFEFIPDFLFTFPLSAFE